jgi:hypothetical protein
MKAVRQRPSGGMKKDVDPQDYRNGDYIDALNVRKIANEDNSTLTVEPVLGNEFAFDLPTVIDTSKIYRIYPTPNASPDLYGIKVYDENGVQVGSVITFTSGTNISQAVTNCANALTAALSPTYATITTGSNYVDVAFDTSGGTEWLDYTLESQYDTFKFLGNIYSPLVIDIISEAISPAIAGPTYAIGSFDLMGDLFIASTTAAGGVGVISVARKNINGVWNITDLITSKELNFSRNYLIDMRVEANNFQTSLYWTDDNNPPRAMYYRNDNGFITNGFLSINGGIYDYGSIDKETRLTVQDLNVRISVTQDVSGGNHPLCSYKYAVRLLTESLVPTNWSYISGLVPMYPQDQNEAGAWHKIVGASTSGQIVTKTNEITVTNIDKKQFRYMEVAVIQYIQNTVTGYMLPRFDVSDDGLTFIKVQHTGYEPDTTNLDLGELTIQKRDVLKSKNIELIDNRLTLSNIEVNYDKDLSDWAQTFEYSIEKEAINSNPYITSPLSTFNGNFEYAAILNNQEKVGYMLNETYRFGIRVKWKNGNWSKAYWVADVTIDNSVGGRKLAGFTDYDLCNYGTGFNDLYAFYVRFTNIDTNYVTSLGIPVKDIIEDVEFVRAECINEILFTGYGVASESGGADEEEFYPSSGGTSVNNIMTLYSPDYIYNQFVGDIVFQSGDKLLSIAHTNNLDYGYPTIDIDGNQDKGVFTNNTFTQSTSFDIFDMSTYGSVGGKMKVSLFKNISPALDVNTSVGTCYVQYYRPKPNKYGDIDNTIYITTGCFVNDINRVTTSSTIDVFGGDTFINKTLVKSKIFHSPNVGLTVPVANYIITQNRTNSNLRYNLDSDYAIPGQFINNIADLEVRIGVADYYDMAYLRQYNNQNIVQNWLAFNPDLPENGDLPNQIIWSESKAYNQLKDSYRDIPVLNFKDLDLTFGEINGMLNINGSLMAWQPRKYTLNYFNSNNIITTQDGSEVLVGEAGVMARRANDLSTYGTYHKWSLIKGRTQGGKDSVYWVNTEFKKIMRFGADGTVVLSDMKGMRSYFANYLKIFDKPSIEVPTNFDNPQTGIGIHGVFDERFSDVIFTFNYRRLIDGSAIFNSRTICFNEATNNFETFYTFKPRLYMKYKDTFLSTAAVIDVKDDYKYLTENQLFEHNRDEYLLWYCTVGNSGVNTFTWVKDALTATYSSNIDNLYPVQNALDGVLYITIGGKEYKIVNISGNTITVDSPILANSGTSAVDIRYCVGKEGYIEMVVNQDPNTSKRFISTQWATNDAPHIVEYRTDKQKTTQLREEFETREDFHYCTIFNDELTGSKTSDTTALWGRWVKVKMYFAMKEYNKLFNFVIKLYDRTRTYNT